MNEYLPSFRETYILLGGKKVLHSIQIRLVVSESLHYEGRRSALMITEKHVCASANTTYRNRVETMRV